MDIHFRHSELEGLFAANAFFQRAWIKGDAVTELRNAEFNEAHARGESLRPEPIGVAKASLGALLRQRLKDSGPLLKHGLIDVSADPFGKAFGAFSPEELHNRFEQFKLDSWVMCAFS